MSLAVLEREVSPHLIEYLGRMDSPKTSSSRNCNWGDRQRIQPQDGRAWVPFLKTDRLHRMLIVHREGDFQREGDPQMATVLVWPEFVSPGLLAVIDNARNLLHLN